MSPSSHAAAPAAAQPQPRPAPAGGLTLPRRLAELALARPTAVALQEKRYGIWHPITWADLAAQVRDLAHGLATLGVRRGERIGILGDNRPEWLIAELAAQCLGAAIVGVHPASTERELQHVFELAEVRVVVAEDQEQVDKLVARHGRLRALEHVVYYDPHGLEHHRDRRLARFRDVAAAGRRLADACPGWLDGEIAAGGADDPAVACATDGATAPPRLAVLSHRNLLATAQALHQVDPRHAGERYVSVLPLAWIGEQVLAVACGLAHALTLAFPEDVATQRADLREIGPDVLLGPPRLWDSLLASVQVRIDDAGWIKRQVFGWAYGVGEAVANRRARGERPGPGLAAAHRIADAVALRHVRDQLGLARLRHGYTAGAPLSPDVLRFFRAIGVHLKQIYGQTEICGVATCHRDGDVRLATAGAPLPGTELRIAGGEILLRSPGVFTGYLGDPRATAGAIDQDGWLHTGDAGELDGDHLVVVDRCADLATLPDGSRVSRGFVENQIKLSPYIAEAMAIATERGVAAIVWIDPDTTGAWAHHARLHHERYADLAGKPEVGELIAGELARCNAGLPDALRVRRFALLHRQLEPGDGELTRTRKLRRHAIAERHAELVAALARGDDRATVRTTLRDPDGAELERTLTLAIRAPLDPEAVAARRRPIWSRRA